MQREVARRRAVAAESWDEKGAVGNERAHGLRYVAAFLEAVSSALQGWAAKERERCCMSIDENEMYSR